MQVQDKNKICAVYGEGAVTDWTSQTWFAKFYAGDASRSGRPVEVGSDEIELLTENNRGWHILLYASPCFSSHLINIYWMFPVLSVSFSPILLSIFRMFTSYFVEGHG